MKTPLMLILLSFYIGFQIIEGKEFDFQVIYECEDQKFVVIKKQNVKQKIIACNKWVQKITIKEKVEYAKFVKSEKYQEMEKLRQQTQEAKEKEMQEKQQKQLEQRIQKIKQNEQKQKQKDKQVEQQQKKTKEEIQETEKQIKRLKKQGQYKKIQKQIAKKAEQKQRIQQLKQQKQQIQLQLDVQKQNIKETESQLRKMKQQPTPKIGIWHNLRSEHSLEDKHASEVSCHYQFSHAIPLILPLEFPQQAQRLHLRRHFQEEEKKQRYHPLRSHQSHPVDDIIPIFELIEMTRLVLYNS